MSHLLLLECFIAGLIGITFQILIKIGSLKKRSIAANENFSASMYFRNDWPTLAVTVVTVLAGLLTINEIITWQPSVLKFIRFAFIFIGYTGSSILQVLFSVTEKKILNVIDKKTNIADGKEDGS